MVRAPCCEKMGVKKGPWTKEEDEILVSFIQSYGHGNWRALPKLAGLSRCGKSCRLRWTNYLRPDIKRGNFTKEEEDMIIALHQMLGNRWSAIAARLPGRTDNEIKNVWHTHLKKRANCGSSESTTENAMKNDAVNASNCLYSEEASSKFDGFGEIEESFWVDALCMDRADVDNYNDGIDDVSFWYDVFVENGD